LTELASDGDFYTQEEIKTLSNMPMNAGLCSTEIDIPGHASALLSVYPEIGSKQSGSTLYAVGRRSEFMIRHSTLRILKRIITW
jgi:hexosaminidase